MKKEVRKNIENNNISNLKNINNSKYFGNQIISAHYRMFVVLLILMLIILLTSFVIAQQDPPAFNVCCEKTNNGAWCQNSLEDSCNQIYRKTPTSCEATSFCKPGCCIDTDEGICSANTPERVCEETSGTWLDDSVCNVPQCSLGCCILGDQASFVTLTRCKKLSTEFGLKTNFRRDIIDELSCIQIAHSAERGACVFESEGVRTCSMTTRGTCETGGRNVSAGEFFVGFLCSADELGTDCGPTEKTTCLEGKDEVYFLDSCGNPTNIYDADKVFSKNAAYWQKIVRKSESCNPDEGNINSKSCGNCNYLGGSICGKGDAETGDFFCRDLNCYDTINGNDYKNGESWCMYQSETGLGKDSVGSRHFRHICIHGEEVIEPCADFRNEVCFEEKVQGVDFIEAGCRVNRWQDCLDQFDEESCLNTDKRECYWEEGFHYEGSPVEGPEGQQTQLGEAEEDVENPNVGILNEGFICLPNVPPGLKFWEEGDAQSTCALGSSRQLVLFEKTFFEEVFGGEEAIGTCIENCEPLTDQWVSRMNDICVSLGDCGSYINIAGRLTTRGIVVRDNGKRRILGGILGGVKNGASGNGGDSGPGKEQFRGPGEKQFKGSEGEA